jgi:hypothetical protein
MSGVAIAPDVRCGMPTLGITAVHFLGSFHLIESNLPCFVGVRKGVGLGGNGNTFGDGASAGPWAAIII